MMLTSAGGCCPDWHDDHFFGSDFCIFQDNPVPVCSNGNVPGRKDLRLICCRARCVFGSFPPLDDWVTIDFKIILQFRDRLYLFFRGYGRLHGSGNEIL
jgi:hypothetical protein